MSTLDASFERDLKDALAEAIEHETVGKPGNLVHRITQEIEDRFGAWATRNDYDAEHVPRSFTVPEVTQTEAGVRVRWRYDHPFMGYAEFGTSPHRVQGQPILSFIWEEPPPWVRQEFEPEGDGYRVFLPEVFVAGIPESRAIRDTLEGL